jgi:hypothetical protein
VILLAGIIALYIIPNCLSAKKDAAKEAYSMETVALKGPETTDVHGRSLTSGISIARLVTPEYSKSIKLVLLK